MYEDGVDVACDLDCPVGKSVTEMRGQWKEFSPCCGELDCVCTDATRQSPWLCVEYICMPCLDVDDLFFRCRIVDPTP
jgi:hypothetical protein